MAKGVKRKIEVWDRQPGERGKHWEAFQIYRDLPAGERTLAKVAELLGKSATLMERWSGEDGWVARSHQFDVFVDQETQQRTRFERHAKQMAMLDRHTTVAQLVQNKLIGQFQTMSDAEWKVIPFGQKVQAFHLMAQFERLSRGLPTDSIEVRTPEQIRMQTITEAKLYLNEVRHDFPFVPANEHLRIICDEFEVTPEELGESVSELGEIS